MEHFSCLLIFVNQTFEKEAGANLFPEHQLVLKASEEDTQGQRLRKIPGSQHMLDVNCNLNEQYPQPHFQEASRNFAGPPGFLQAPWQNFAKKSSCFSWQQGITIQRVPGTFPLSGLGFFQCTSLRALHGAKLLCMGTRLMAGSGRRAPVSHSAGIYTSRKLLLSRDFDSRQQFQCINSSPILPSHCS